MHLVPADLSLFPATPEQILEGRRRSAAEWGHGLTLEQYIRRGDILHQKEHAAGNRHITWVLAPRSDPATLDFMCSCQTYRRNGVVAKCSMPSDVIAYGVASVYTPASKRGYGYARHMMRLLHWILAPRSALPSSFPAEWGAPPRVHQNLGLGDAQFSVLYSAIGPEFYRACGPSAEAGNGWLIGGHVSTMRDLAAVPVARDVGVDDADTAGRQWKLLSLDEVKTVFDRDAEWMAQDLAIKSAQSPKTLFTFLPNHGVGAYANEFALKFTNDGQLVMPFDSWGVMLLPSGTSSVADVLQNESRKEAALATWSVDVFRSTPTLVVTRLRATTDNVVSLLDEIEKAARREGMLEVDILNLPEAFQAAARERGWKTFDRTDYLPSFKWYGEEKEDDVEWLFSERFCWC
ncbi:hypothetical protein WOLCODRAFT_139317 [Wolfiporia cocos MD-104 SS10]|uniref:LYC1 C-terminal domain-containing protein n=1 Tax=Wolfiporia cocos (strain MD-104) TaxID=742152 RepID=A0A2H3K404_WOLCO|nr:hypothetical protein WOLCODRAFT_139317 [Wolfiporia cocos MD-104 SS10]